MSGESRPATDLRKGKPRAREQVQDSEIISIFVIQLKPIVYSSMGTSQNLGKLIAVPNNKVTYLQPVYMDVIILHAPVYMIMIRHYLSSDHCLFVSSERELICP